MGTCYSPPVVVSERSFWPATLSVAYVCAAAWQSSGLGAGLGGSFGPWALVTLPLGVFAVWRFSAPRGDTRELGPSGLLRACLRAAAWGALLWLAARLAPAGRAGFEAIGNLGVASAVVAACVCLARMPTGGGILRPRPAALSLDAAAFIALIWGVAIAVPLSRVVAPDPGVWIDPLAVDYATTAAALASLLVLMASAWRVRHGRRLELGIADRASGALALCSTAFATAVPAAAANVAAPDRILPLAALGASLAMIATVRAKQAASVARVLRVTIAVMLLGVPAALIAATLAGAHPQHAALIVLCSGLFCVAVGLAAQVLAAPLGPERSRWLHAIESASRGALEPEPDAALIATLRALDKSNLDSSTRCEIWQRHPEQSLSINVAGYLQVDAARAPERLYELAEAEPHNTLRTSVLEEMQVRRPEVRPLLAWLQAHGALCVTLIVEQDAAIGFLLVPRGRRRSAMTIEEVESLQLLTRRLSALLAVSSALARSREREMLAREQAQILQTEKDRLQRQQAGRAQADRAFAEMLARPVRAARYSASARHTAAQIETANRTARAILLLTPPGVDAVGWGAFAHLDGAHQGGPLLVMDAAATGGEAEAAAWDEPERSPFKLAEGGTLVIVNFQALLAAGSASDVPAGLLQLHHQLEHLEVRSATAPALVLVCSTQLTGSVEAWASRHSSRGSLQRVVLPTLLERAEDLRPLILEHLTRLGPGSDGEPLGIEPAALRTLVEHTWPGNDAELKGVLTRAHARCRGPRITLDDVAELDANAAQPPASAAGTLDPILTEFSFGTNARRRHSPRKH